VSEWKKIWDKRGVSLENGRKEEILVAMKKAAGFDLVEEGLNFNSFLEQWKRIDKNVSFSYDNRKISSVYEVGCGAGANLYFYQIMKKKYRLGGIDYSESMINSAKKFIKTNDLKIGEAIEIDVNPKYDVVISNGVFPYFENYEYAEVVLEKMYEKCNNSIAILDIFDINLKEEFIKYRKSIIEDYDEKYKNLDKLFFGKEFFIKFAEVHNMDIKFGKADIKNYYNDKFVFDCYLYKK
jgi:2-polyprenyl-3-methyl-5-hydroxy-6-metoxy-1,4-benzoquinol methylase